MPAATPVAMPRTAPAAAVATAVPAPKAPKPKRDVESIVGGRGLLYAGALLVAAGVAFFLKIAFDRGWIGPPMRVTLGIVAGVALIAAASALRKRLPAYFADTIVGLGAAFCYLSLWAGGSLFNLLPVVVVAIGTLAVTIAVCVLAYRDNRQPLAYVGIVGGLISPLLLQSTAPDPLRLFTYLAMLSAGAIALSELRGWRGVPVVSLAGSAFYWLVFSFFESQSAYPLGERIAIALVMYAVYASASVVAWRRRAPFDGWRVTLAALNAAWFFLGVSAVASDDHLVLALIFLAMTAVHLLMGAQFNQRAQFWIATIALAFAIPPSASSCAPLLPPEAVVGLTHVLWVVEATAVGVWAARSSDRVLLGLSFAIFSATVLAATWTSDAAGSRLLLNERFVSFALAAAGMTVVRREYATLGRLRGAGATISRILIDIVALIAISPEAYRAGQLLQPHNADQSASVALSIAWAVYGGALVVFGIRANSAASRWEGLTLIAITVLKVFLVDLTGVDMVFRVISAMVLGILMLGLAFLYQTRLRAASASKAPGDS